MSTRQESDGFIFGLGNSLSGNVSGLIVVAALFFVFSLLMSNSTFAATADTSEQTLEFDHLTTGYDLDGQHRFLECGQCHINGVFKGTPIVCDGCHDGVVAKGKTAAHFKTEEQCDLCHTTSTILETNATMDHSTITESCVSCHNGITTIGKSTRHVKTSELCEACHTTVAFIPALGVDHSQVNGSCQACHNGLIATGQSANHQPTSDLCEACHTTVAWAPPLFPVDHAEVRGACSACHNGQIAVGKNLNHIESSDVCEVCHNTVSFVPATGGLSAKSVSHILTSNNCTACHIDPNAFLSVPPSAVDHNEVIGICVSCHNTTIASGKGAVHLPTSNTCDACHQPGPMNWVPVASMSVDHNEVIGDCIVCHNGTTPSGGGTNVSGKSGALHAVGQTTNNCDACHLVGVSWAPVAVANVDHFEINGVCGNCHNGTIATGVTVTHPVILPGTDCVACHSPNTWLGAVIDHNGVDTNTCGTACHVAAPQTIKGPNHIVVTANSWCGSCHTTNVWVPVLRVDHNLISGSCVSCHFPASTVSTYSKANDPNHIASSDACDACHSTISFVPVVLVNHAEVIGVCSTCHNGVISIGVGVNHIPINTQECDICHRTTGWIPTSFNHTGIGTATCVSCHNGVLATGKPANHIPINAEQCDGCHSSGAANSWRDIPAVDHGLVAGSCVSCHNGGISLGKTPTHIATTDICEACHNTMNFTVVAVVDHAEVLGSCKVCHDGTISTGKTPTHPATTNMCDACHAAGALAWTPIVTVDHNEVIGSCVRCHDGSVSSFVKDANHINSTNICDACHNTTKFAPVVQVDHNEVNGTCSVCHNGTIAIGKDADHAQTSNACEACHNTIAFRPVANVDHNEVIGTCGACHNGTIAKGQGSRHFVYSALECSDCHDTTRWIISSTYPHDLAGMEYPRPDHRFGNINCRTCHTGGTSTIPAALTLCARCHQNDFSPGDHRNATVSDLRDCSGACHIPGPEHRADGGGW